MIEAKNKDGFCRRLWHEIARFLSVGMIWLLYRVKVYGKENIPRDGGVLVLSNHQSFFDPMICQGWLRRPFYYVPRDTLFVGFLGWLIDSYYTIPINQEQVTLKSMKAIIDVLKRGHIVCLYPEGSRTFDGKIDEIKPGFSLLVRRSKATIVPMVIDGIFERWPRTQKYPKVGGCVGIIYGKPIPAEYIQQVGEEAFIAEFNHIMQTLHNDLRQKMGKEPYDYAS
ncbi:MAG: 1-acyl-sn-glycerol-3-phosphate acyltransferase [Planctomycetes bacterium]|nr:1-acyl-sn-glycerol-3-phosphate acyltransferase [Planctomycetota bacterium]